MREDLRAELVAMEADDLRVRARLAADRSLFHGYHPEMEAVHRRNAARLREIIAELAAGRAARWSATTEPARRGSSCSTRSASRSSCAHASAAWRRPPAADRTSLA